MNIVQGICWMKKNVDKHQGSVLYISCISMEPVEMKHYPVGVLREMLRSSTFGFINFREKLNKKNILPHFWSSKT